MVIMNTPAAEPVKGRTSEQDDSKSTFKAVDACADVEARVIAVDREDRPDLDRLYMDFLQATSGIGGWPLNVFLTPDLHPFFGGTYWPGPDAARARPGAVTFEHILLRVADAWRDQEARCRQDGLQVVRQLREFAQEGTLGSRRMSLNGDDAADDEAGEPDPAVLPDSLDLTTRRKVKCAILP